MKYLNIVLFVVAFCTSFSTEAKSKAKSSAASSSSKVVPKKVTALNLMILDSIPPEEREAKYTSWQADEKFSAKLRFCKSISLSYVDFPTMESKDTWMMPSKDDPVLLYIAMNPVWSADETKNDNKTKALFEYASRFLETGHSIVFSSGKSESGEPKMISRTLAQKMMDKTSVGKPAQVLVIGELSEKETLLKDSHFGPEMFTAVKPPRELMEKGIGAYIFAHDLACAMQLNPSLDPFGRLNARKKSSRKIWIPVEELFP